jgi:universal stress protein A
MTPPSAGKQPTPGKPPGVIAPWIRSILVPIDFSDCSWAALNHAIPIAQLMGAKIALLNVCQAQLVATEFAHLPGEELSMRRSSEEKLRSSAKGRVPTGILGDILVRNGVAYEEIIKAAQECDVDLIVINTHGRTGLKHAMLGSTTEHVVRSAPCPVLVIREPASDSRVN